jgi:hypothetical protein
MFENMNMTLKTSRITEEPRKNKGGSKKENKPIFKCSIGDQTGTS